MKRVGRSVWCFPLALTALLATLSCGDRSPLTGPADPRASAMAGGNGSRVKIKQLQLESNKLAIGGPATTYAASLGNSGLAIPDGVYLRGEIVQGATTQPAGLVEVNCEPGDPDKLPTGTCNTGGTAAAANSPAGSGTLVAGSATYVLHVVETDGTNETELASKSVAITLVANPVITDLTLASTTLAIEGPGSDYTVTIDNPTGGSVPGVVLQGYIVQGSTTRAAGGTAASCPSLNGTLPVGSCTMSFVASASNSAAGTGTLVPGAATFRLDLIQTIGTQTTLDSRSVPITLVPNRPQITDVDLGFSELVIGGAPASYDVTLENPTGAEVGGIRIQAYIVQGSAKPAAGGSVAECGSAAGVVPPGSCTYTLFTLAPANAGLTAGDATLELDLIQAVNGADVTLETKTVSIQLASAAPTITAVGPSPLYLVIDGASLSPYQATIDNPGEAISSLGLQAYVAQGGPSSGAGGGPLECAGASSGTLPSGTCSAVAGANASTQTGVDIAPGPATFRVDLYPQSNSSTVLATKTVDAILVKNTPSIVSIVFDTDPPQVVIGDDGVAWTTTVYNPTTSTITDVLIDAVLTQGSVTTRSGSFVAHCPASDATLPPGPCTMPFSSYVTNANLANGTFVAGSANFVVTMYSNFRSSTPTVLDVKTIPVTLVSPAP